MFFFCFFFIFFFFVFFFFFSSRRRHTRFDCDWSSDVCSSDLEKQSPGMERRSNTRIAAGVRITTLGSRGFELGPVAVEGGPLGHCQPGRQRRTAANGTHAVVVRSEERRVGKECRSVRWGDDRR